MFTKTTSRKFVIVLVALVLCLTLVFAACKSGDHFTPPAKPADATPVGNGGIAVQYGEWIYYVNGYQKSNTAVNTYETSEVRTGAVVRIKISDLDKLIKLHDVDAGSTYVPDAISYIVAGRKDKITNDALSAAAESIGKAEVVVPVFYYTANETETHLNGIYIFNNRLYVTTPNNKLDANGNYLSSQLVLASYDLDGTNEQRHLVFDVTNPKLSLNQVGSDVFATYVVNQTDSEGTTSAHLISLKIGASTPQLNVADVYSPVFTSTYVFYQNENGTILRHTIGSADEPITVVNNEPAEDGTKTGKTLEIVSTNGDYVYYTCMDENNPVLSGKKLELFSATNVDNSNTVILKAIPTDTYFCYENSVVYVADVADREELSQSRYTILVSTDNTGTAFRQLLEPDLNGDKITLEKIDGSILYYSINNETYTWDLSDPAATAQLYAKDFSFSTTGWSVPDMVEVTEGKFAFSLDSNGNVLVTKFNPTTEKSSKSTTITLKSYAD